MPETTSWGELRPRVEGDFVKNGVTFAGFWERSDSPVRRVEPASTSAVLIFPMRGGMEINGVRIDSPVMIRPSSEPTHTTHTTHAGSQCCIEVRVPLLLATTLQEEEEGEAAAGALPIFLKQALQPPRSASWQDHFDFASDTVRAMLASAKPTKTEKNRLVEAAWAALRSEGVGHLDELASQLGVSSRHLRRSFQTITGFSPSGAIQLARFERAWALVRKGSGSSLADIAAAAGYCDQAHMTRAFSQLAGISPARAIALLAGPLPGLVHP